MIIPTIAADFETSNLPRRPGGSTIEQEYRDYFLLSPEQQQAARRRELGVRRYQGDGKASIECFRIASARILSLVQDLSARAIQREEGWRLHPRTRLD
jgi:hypothetical protein